jgi:hypothetical protein
MYTSLTIHRNEKTSTCWANARISRLTAYPLVVHLGYPRLNQKTAGRGRDKAAVAGHDEEPGENKHDIKLVGFGTVPPWRSVVSKWVDGWWYLEILRFEFTVEGRLHADDWDLLLLGCHALAHEALDLAHGAYVINGCVLLNFCW